MNVPWAVRSSVTACAIVRLSFAEVEPANLVTGQQIRRWALQSVAPIRQDVAPVANRQRLAGTLLDHQHGRPAPVDLDHVGQDRLDHLGRETGRRLVEQENARLQHQRARNSQRLPLTTGEAAGPLAGPLRQDREEFEYPRDPLFDSVRTRDPAHGQVFPDGQAGEDVVGLRYEGDAPTDQQLRRQTGYVIASKGD